MIIIKSIYYGLLGICLATLLLNSKRLNRIYFWFIPIIIFAITVQASQDILKLKEIKGYDFVFHIYQPVEYSLLALFYFQLINNALAKKFILASIPVVLLFSVIYYSVGNGVFYGSDFIDFCVCAFFINIWVVIFFIELLRSDEKMALVQYPAFWVNAANMLFYGGCLMIMGVYFSVLNTDPVTAKQLLSVNHYLNLVLYSMYIIGFTQPIKWTK
jgi:hypothetical protein